MRIRDKERLSAWDGDWEKRINDRIEELGYRDYRDYLRARPGRSYRDLAKELSRDEEIGSIAPVQLQHLHAQSVTPAERQEAQLDSFVRFIRPALRKGWGVGIYWDTDVLGAMACWFVTWGEEPQLDAFRREILRMNPPEGWKPDTSDDSIIHEAARRISMR
jgi:hypothetical protein